MPAYVYLFRIDDASQREAMGTPERAQQSMQRWLTWIRELETSGHLSQRGQPLERDGKVVRGRQKVVRGRQKVVTDGPFAESKDVVNGFLIVEAKDANEAAELAKGCPILDGNGSVEVRPVMKIDF